MGSGEGVVIINREGKYLSYSQTSSHSSDRVYHYQWTSNLDEASVITPMANLLKLKWKEGSPLEYAVAEIPAQVTHKVHLMRPCP